MSLLFAFSSPFGEELHFLDAYSHGQSISRVVQRDKYRSIAGTPENLERILTNPNMPDILFLYGHGDVVGDPLLLEDRFCERVPYFLLRLRDLLLDRIRRNHRKGGVLILGMCFSKGVFDMVRTELEQTFSHIVVANGAIRGRVLNLFSLHFLELLFGGSTVLKSFLEAMEITCGKFPATARDFVELFPNSRAHHEIPLVQHFGGLDFETRVAELFCPPLADVVVYVKFGYTVSHDVYYALHQDQRKLGITANRGCGVSTILKQLAYRCSPRGKFGCVHYVDIRERRHRLGDHQCNALAAILHDSLDRMNSGMGLNELPQLLNRLTSPSNPWLVILDGCDDYCPEHRDDMNFINEIADVCPSVTVLFSVHHKYRLGNDTPPHQLLPYWHVHLDRMDDFGVAWLILVSIQNDSELNIDHVTRNKSQAQLIKGLELEERIKVLATILQRFSCVVQLQGNPLAARHFYQSTTFRGSRDFRNNESRHCTLADQCLNQAVDFKRPVSISINPH